MKEKQILVMTSFGPVPFNAVKDYINPEVAKAIEKNKEAIISAMERSSAPTELSYYVNSLAQKKGWKPEKMAGFLNNLSEINLGAAFQVILREVAVELDKKYEDHIEKSEEIYCVSLTNGHIFKADKQFIKNFRNFSAFRTLDDAKLACKITRGLLKDMFKSGRK